VSEAGGVAGPDEFDYDVCLSFAGEQREYVEAVAEALERHGVRYFYDRDQEDDLWGKDLYTHLDEVYRKKSRFCVMFGSADYVRKEWTNHERISAQARALQQPNEYVLPVLFDDAEIPGLRNSIGYLNAERFTPGQLAEKIIQKLARSAPSTAKPPSRGRPEAAALAVNRWRVTADSTNLFPLAHATTMSLPDSDVTVETQPILRIGIAVPSEPLPADAIGPPVWRKLRGFLQQEAVLRVVSGLTYIGSGRPGSCAPGLPRIPA
jgi:hypothetical protein